MVKVIKGMTVDTKRRRSITVLSDQDGAGWFLGRTLGGQYLSFSSADVVKVHDKTSFHRA